MPICINVSILVLLDFSLRHVNALESPEGFLVSILVLLDFSLRRLPMYLCRQIIHQVSILVLLDFSLRHVKKIREEQELASFNPCSIGF